MTVLIAGGGIAGLALALTCEQIGVPFKVYESREKIEPLGVGINLQPTAVRELFDLGLQQSLDAIGVQTRDYSMYSKRGLLIWTEPRGCWAGYQWPQYSVHRGHLHTMLYHTLLERAGPDCVETGWSACGFDNVDGRAQLHLRAASGDTRTVNGELIIGADGIHSALRAQMVPDEGDPIWGGAVLWRGTTRAVPYKTGASMIMLGHAGRRFVTYPISRPDPDTGEAVINWIANLNYNADSAWNKEDYSREADLNDFLPRFAELKFDWLDVAGLITGAERVYEYPMVDREPIDRWTHGRVSLMGDAAHAAYPVGSNGAGSAIIDARELGAAFLKHGLNEQALQAYEAKMRPPNSRVVLINRTAGPDSILDTVEERCGGQFDDIEDVIPKEEMAAHAEKYKMAAGFGIDETNRKAPTIAAGAKWLP